MLTLAFSILWVSYSENVLITFKMGAALFCKPSAFSSIYIIIYSLVLCAVCFSCSRKYRILPAIFEGEYWMRISDEKAKTHATLFAIHFCVQYRTVYTSLDILSNLNSCISFVVQTESGSLLCMCKVRVKWTFIFGKQTKRNRVHASNAISRDYLFHC